MNFILNYSSAWANFTSSNYNYLTDENPFSYFFQTSNFAYRVFLIMGIKISDYTSRWTKSSDVKLTNVEFFYKILEYCYLVISYLSLFDISI